MLYCHICNSLVQQGWVVGFPPAPDSMKFALCPIHNTEALRKKTLEDWQHFMCTVLQKDVENKKHFVQEKMKIAYIHYYNNTIQSFPCISYKETKEHSLELIDAQNNVIFIPLSQVKFYKIEPQ